MITNEEKAREISNNCCQWYSEYNSSFTDCAKAALEAMEWKDEQFTKQKQSFIDNACEWLAKNYQNLDYINMEGDLFDLSMVEDFRKAMEGMK